MQNRIKKITFVTFLLIGALFLSFGYLYQNQNLPQQAKAQAVSRPLEGWAWSSNIGWGKFDGWSDSVEFLPSGKLRGYAWSSNIGWIDFAPSQSDINAAVNLTDPKKPPEIDSATGLMSGYARALSYGDGWDGWMKMSKDSSDGGGAYGVSLNGNKLEGFAWGGDVIGWLGFSGNAQDGSSYGVTIDGLVNCSSFSASPSSVKPSQTTTLSWQCQFANNCNIDIVGGGSLGNVCNSETECNSDNVATPAITKNTTFQLKCTALGGFSTTRQTTVNINFAPTRCEVNPRTGVLECP